MKCDQVVANLNDYIDDYLGEPLKQAVTIHINQCATCHTKIAQAAALKQRLAQLPPTPAPNELFVQRLIKQRAQQNRHHAHQRHPLQKAKWFVGGFSSAAAAILLVWLSGVSENPVMIDMAEQNDTNTYVITALNTPQTINLLFHSDRNLSEVKFSIITPQTVDVEGFSGQRQIVWQWRLNKGDNLLAIPIIIRDSSVNEFVLALEHKNEKREFTVKVDTSKIDKLS